MSFRSIKKLDTKEYIQYDSIQSLDRQTYTFNGQKIDYLWGKE